MKKRIYRAVQVNDVDVGALIEGLEGGQAVVGVDVAKQDMVAALANGQGAIATTVRWRHPAQTPAFVALASRLGRVVVVMEPTGTYGDALRHQLEEAGHSVSLVSAKRVHDAREVYDGVPSSHDGKSAAIIVKLHVDGASRPWPRQSQADRTLKAAVQTLELFSKQYQTSVNRLEAQLARYWPELTEWLELTSRSMVVLLAQYGGPGSIARDPEGAKALLRKTGGSRLAAEKIEAIVESAAATLGVAMIEPEEQAVRILAGDADRARKELGRAKEHIASLVEANPKAKELRAVLGPTTTGVLLAKVGGPEQFEASAALVKACGLNLKIRQSGKREGQLAITKRGSGMVRQVLYLAALRLIQNEPIVHAWYQKKCARDGGLKLKAIVAIMRKLTRALPHLARGQVFDATRLFDARRLTTATATTA